jgi:hypothetical protein
MSFMRLLREWEEIATRFASSLGLDFAVLL